MNVGDIVKYAEPQDGEEGYRFRVMEVNGDRLMVQFIGHILPIPPVETLRLSDVIPFWQQSRPRSFTVPTCGIANTDPLDMTDENFEAWVNCLNRQGKEDWKQRRAEHKEGK